MHLLLCTTPDQQSFLPRFSKLAALIGHRVSVINSTPDTLSELQLKCTKAGIDGILCANAVLLSRILDSQPDFQRPNNRRGLTLDDYQGSFLSLKGIPVVVLNPPEHLMTVPYGAFIFSRFIEKLTKPEQWFEQTPFEWKVFSLREAEETFTDFARSNFIAVDIETPIANDVNKMINCVSFTAYWKDKHKTFSIVIPFDSTVNLIWIRKFLSLPAPKILQGGIFDAVRLLRFNCPIDNWLFDTLHLFHSYYSELPKRLDFVAAFALRNIRYWKDDGKSGNLEDYYRYNALDGWATLNSFLALMGELPSWALKNYVEEFPLVFPSIHCELEGWKVDQVQFLKVKKEKEEEAQQKLEKIRRMLRAANFNPRSPVQMKKLFTILGCGDLPSTDAIHTLKAEARHPLNARILGEIKDYKKASKLLSTYILDFKFWNWRLHYKLNPAGTDTQRLASAESSFGVGFQIQNIPRGDSIKSFLVADSGWRLAEPDFSQSEARCVGYLSGDVNLISLLESGRDYHSWNAQAFFGIPYEKIWDESTGKTRNKEMTELRDLSKRTNHGANYNMTAKVMLDTMGSRKVAEAKRLLRLPAFMNLKDVCSHLLKRYEATYPRVKGDWYNSIITEIETTKKLTSPFGHVRWFFGDPRNNKHHLNSAIAHKPQNLSVSIINRCFYKIWKESVYGSLQKVLRLKAQIHDSLPYQYKEGCEWVNQEVVKLMDYPVEVVGCDKVKRIMRIPIAIASGALRWSELK
jgi:DNA polymerase I-like protein with 3'-5' exonuclease and polymerase domains